MIKLTFILGLSVIFFWSACTTHKEECNGKQIDLLNKSVSLDSLLQQQILSYKLYLDYDSDVQWKLENKHYKLLHKWTKEFRQDTIINKLHRYVIDTTFIIIQAGMIKDLSRETAKKSTI